jgi:esterase/lipase superfamily enzyme
VLADGGGAGAKQLPNRVDNWGPQFAYDWPTWHEVLPQYLRELLT